MNRKVTVVGGAGNVGATVARSLAQRELADVVIVDIADSKAAGITSFRLDNREMVESVLYAVATKAGLQKRGEGYVRKKE